MYDGWILGYLGAGAPRTNNSVETHWKSHHDLAPKRMLPLAMVERLLRVTLPYIIREQGELSGSPDPLLFLRRRAWHLLRVRRKLSAAVT